jgi:hypothetical protein
VADYNNLAQCDNLDDVKLHLVRTLSPTKHTARLTPSQGDTHVGVEREQ